MMKKLVVLFIAVAALFAFSACEPYAVTLDEPGEVEVNDVGIRNYNLSGKTLEAQRYAYIRKRVEVEVINNSTGATTTTTTYSKIPAMVETTTYIFAADGTYTYSETSAYLAGADGDYRATETENVTTATTTTTTTTYTEYDFDGSWVDSLNELVTGRAGKTIDTSSAAGTWERISRQENYGDSITWEYYVTVTSSSGSSTELVSASSNDAPELANVRDTGNTAKDTYTTGDTENYVYATSDEPYPIGDVYWVRDDADGNDIVLLFGKNYTVQP